MNTEPRWDGCGDDTDGGLL